MSNPGPYKFEHTVIIDSTKTSTRKPYYPCEGGALNAGYTDYDVGCIVSNDLGQKGYKYGEDFYYEDSGCDEVVFSCKDQRIKTYLAMKFSLVENGIHG